MQLTRVLMLFVVGLVVGFGVTELRGATFAWGSATTIAGDSDVSTVGTLVAAYNIGDPSVSATTINGVNFAAFPIVDGSASTTSGVLTISSVSGGIKSTLPLGAASGAFAALSPSYQAMLSSGGAKDVNPPVVNVSLSGLIIGRPYALQLWANDSRASFESEFLSGGNPITLDQNTANAVGGVGQYVIGTFVADAVTQLVAASGGLPLVNGVQLRTTAAVPEPGTLCLLALAGVMLALRRR